jgi:acyl-CoA synthetase (AMP-forming)/AMP-acid ligase II
MEASREPSNVGELLARIRRNGDRDAFFWQGRSTSFAELAELVDRSVGRLGEERIGRGTVVGVLADYSPESVGLLLALMHVGAIVAPFSRAVAHEMDSFIELAGVERLFRFDADDRWELETLPELPAPELIREFRACERPGLVVFTSGSTGRPKGILHDCERLVKRFSEPRKAYRTLLFLLFDHFGGFNTLMSVLSYGGTMVVPPERTPTDVARIIEAGRVELLPVTPTLLNLLVASGAAAEHDMSSVQLITYGTEVMPEGTLKKIAELFPQARLQQTYGLSELGVLRSKSQSSDSVWVKVGGQGFETRVVDGILQVRSELAMVGYLNAESPFDSEGWLSTGDRVEQRGEYFRILGRESDIINVGGQKVFPSEVETALLEADNVDDATVYGEKHPLMGSVVMARVKLREPEAPGELRARLRKHCLERLASYKVPIRFHASDEDQHNLRYKKQRPKPGPANSPSA